MTGFVAQLATARKLASDARKACDTARLHVRPMDADTHAALLAHDPVRYAQCLRQVADIMEGIPALDAARTAADEALKVLADRACYACHGTGEYSAPTSAFRNGKPYCFKCGGTGESAASRKAHATA